MPSSDHAIKAHLAARTCAQPSLPSAAPWPAARLGGKAAGGPLPEPGREAGGPRQQLCAGRPASGLCQLRPQHRGCWSRAVAVGKELP